MLYFVIGTEPNQQEFSWHVGEGIPRISKVEHIYADGHELEYLQRLGFGVDNTNGNVKLYGDRAMSALRAMRLDAATHRPTDDKPKSDATIGKLRQQSALCDSDRRVVLVSSDPEVSKILAKLEVTDMFQDSTNEHGSFGEPTFKIRVGKR
jgi:hypothetical protein